MPPTGAQQQRPQQQQPPQPPQRHPGRIRDLSGLPVPTASGAILPLGRNQLLVVPPPPPGSAWRHPVSSGLLPPDMGREFVHESCVAALESHFKDPALRRELKLQFYGLPQISVHVVNILGPDWVSRHGSRVAQAAVRWDGGAAGGPMPDWLRKLATLCRGVSGLAADWGVEVPAAPFEALDSLLIFPLADGRLMRFGLREAALVADGGVDEVGDGVVESDALQVASLETRWVRSGVGGGAWCSWSLCGTASMF